jgi:hypothetical protein
LYRSDQREVGPRAERLAFPGENNGTSVVCIHDGVEGVDKATLNLARNGVRLRRPVERDDAHELTRYDDRAVLFVTLVVLHSIMANARPRPLSV